MRLPRTAGSAIAAKEFAQWIASVQGQSQQARKRLCPSSVERRGGESVSDLPSLYQDSRDVGVAVSGGVDSMALLTLLSRHYRSLADTHRTKLHAFIVDHKLRHNSTEEAEFVAMQVQKLGTRHLSPRASHAVLPSPSSCSHDVT